MAMQNIKWHEEIYQRAKSLRDTRKKELARLQFEVDAFDSLITSTERHLKLARARGVKEFDTNKILRSNNVHR